MRCGMQGHMAEPRERLHGAQVARMRGRATRVQVDALMVPRDKCVFGLAGDGPTGIVGPGKIVGARMQRT